MDKQNRYSFLKTIFQYF